MEQRTKEWFEARLGRATASRFADVMATIKSGEAAARRNYRAELVAERLTGVPSSSFTSTAMQWGIDTEPLARLAYELRTGRSIEPAFFTAHPKLMAGASTDGYIGNDGLAEIKCPETATHIETLKTQKIPSKYIPQIIGQLWIEDRQWVDFISYDPRMPLNAQLFVKRYLRDDQELVNMMVVVENFLREVDAEEKFVRNYGK